MDHKATLGKVPFFQVKGKAKGKKEEEARGKRQEERSKRKEDEGQG